MEKFVALSSSARNLLAGDGKSMEGAGECGNGNFDPTVLHQEFLDFVKVGLGAGSKDRCDVIEVSGVKFVPPASFAVSEGVVSSVEVAMPCEYILHGAQTAFGKCCNVDWVKSKHRMLAYNALANLL
jgi:hypothetical protein